jgi:hypothetical protein
MKLDTRFLVITGLIILAALTRLLPHIPNFTAVSAVALFGAAQYNKKIMAFLVPLTALLLSDAVLGFYQGMEWIYGTFILIVITGFALRNKLTVSRVILLSVTSSLLMYIFSDLGVWIGTTMYPHTWAGFTACYVAALPFLRNELLGDLFYSGLLFGTFYIAQLKFPKLLKERVKK